MNKTCPNCGALLIKDAWETVETNDNGSYVFKSYLALKCLQRCGYYERADQNDQE
ncbi:hypothetical protein LGQ02_09190 [Bacillus shivajii]|uniref:hypothetical protein n=1 Tax=Bacillus shivajii TaxID=1983719 RepID=UPI001CFB3AC1|nr:hypothetical protein [Bacillus shivajii]UCZ54896.1 hypothetical protein LGQ02_09190 [Bacillus shivajii]